MSGPCAKQTVTATIVTEDGFRFTATNYVLNPQATCPRGDMPTGTGYHLCQEVCHQTGHAEVNALRIAGHYATGATLYLQGHGYACDPCLKACESAGIAGVVMGPPPCAS